MTANELRKSYIDFFKSKGHKQIKSASLIPENDPSVLFITAGMQPMVPFLKGEPHPAGKRIVDFQKCVRTVDIEDVGDETHLTFFEMLGNWSLGDYFKKESIQWSFELLTEVLNIPTTHLAVSVFEGDTKTEKDSESANLWENLGINKERIAYLDKEENWWPAGGKNPGPQGPDTEIFYWTGKEEPPKFFDPENQKWVEIWNNVFMQYDINESGEYTQLEQKNVDTGMGLERILLVLQGKESVYETELFTPIIKKIEEITGKNYKDERYTRKMRIIADHTRAATVLIADGADPSNKDQGYIVRRLIRRAVRQLSNLEAEESIKEISETCINTLKDAYPELEEKKQELTTKIEAEEQKFKKTLDKGLKVFKKLLETNGKIGGKEAFLLYQSYGFPLELTEELVKEQGKEVDKASFQAEFQRHQQKSREGSQAKFKGGLADDSEESKKLHTATHLLHKALKIVLGDHIAQKGSNITQERLRFDFSHPEKLTEDQKREVEEIVNNQIQKKLPVSVENLTVEEAEKEGAIGLFKDKYSSIGDKVKVYTIGNAETEEFSKEICGGPHATNTEELIAFAITKEQASSAGIRRIKAVIGEKAKNILKNR